MAKQVLKYLAAGLALTAMVAALALARPAPSDAADQKAIRQALEDQTAAWNRADVDTFMTYYWKSDKTEFVGAGGILRGWSTVLDRYRRTYPDAKAMGQLTFGNLEIQMFSPDSAYVLGEFHLHREKDLSGVFTLIMRKLPDGWRVVSDHTTAYPAAAEHP